MKKIIENLFDKGAHKYIKRNIRSCVPFILLYVNCNNV